MGTNNLNSEVPLALAVARAMDLGRWNAWSPRERGYVWIWCVGFLLGRPRTRQTLMPIRPGVCPFIRTSHPRPRIAASTLDAHLSPISRASFVNVSSDAQCSTSSRFVSVVEGVRHGGSFASRLICCARVRPTKFHRVQESRARRTVSVERVPSFLVSCVAYLVAHSLLPVANTSNHPGYRLVFNTLGPRENFFPRIPGVFAGCFHMFHRKHADFELHGWDVITYVRANFPVYMLGSGLTL